MADKEKPQKPQDQKGEKPEKKKYQPEEEKNEILVRILGYDIPGSRNLYSGLTRIKGISWSISNATCLKLNMPKSKKVESLTKDDIAKIETFLKKIPVADFMKNRRSDPETGESLHLFGSDLDIKREFDIKRLKEIRSYKGMRHIAKLPVRGQRTRSHFRKKGIAMGVKRKKE